MKLILIVFIGGIACSMQSADRPDEPKKIDYKKLFVRSGRSDDSTSIYYYLEHKNSNALEGLIAQATADKRLDVLENALKFAFQAKNANAVDMLLRAETPIQSGVIKSTIDFFIDHSLMTTKQQALYAKEYQLYENIVRSIMGSDKKENFKMLADYAISKGNRSVLVWLLLVAVFRQNTSHAMELIDRYIESLDASYLNYAIQELTTMMNSADVQYRGTIQSMIDSLNKALRNR